METLLKHLVDMTCQRDHALLDRSVVSALYELAGAQQVRVHELSQFRGATWLKSRVWIEDGKAVGAGEPMLLDHGGVPLGHFPALLEGITQRQSRIAERRSAGEHVLWLPVWLNDKVNCCVEVVRQAPCDSHVLSMIEGILCVYRNFQNVLDYSERDSLTGLLNRKTFDEKFSHLLSAAYCNPTLIEGKERRHAPQDGQWLGVIDIDHFKRVNDQFGHLYGDEVLILIANLLRTSFRAHDRVFRFGGEEFVVLLRSVSMEHAHKIFERFRHNVEQHGFPQVGKVTVSVGFASITSESPVVILGRADQALYYAKESGRNQVCLYDELVSSGKLRSQIASAVVEFF